MFKHESIVIGHQNRVDGHRYQACVHRSEKANRPVAAIKHQQKDAFFTPQTQCLQAGGKCANPVVQFGKPQAFTVIDKG